MNEEISIKVAEYIIKSGDLAMQPQDITLDLLLREDLDMDSVGSISAIMDLEDYFDVVIEDKRLASLKTVGDVIALVEEELGKRNEACA